jgi:hypothetical protein
MLLFNRNAVGLVLPFTHQLAFRGAVASIQYHAVLHTAIVWRIPVVLAPVELVPLALTLYDGPSNRKCL